jgi:hypothetical protein
MRKHGTTVPPVGHVSVDGALRPGVARIAEVEPTLQETAKSTRVQITYESPLVSYVIYEGQCKLS